MTNFKWLLAVPAALVLQACSSDSDHSFEAGVEAQQSIIGPVAAFDPTGSPPVIPFPNALLYPLTPDDPNLDGTINAPAADPDNIADPIVALNQMDGFSTTSPIVTPLARELDPASITIGSSIRVIEVITDPTLGFATTGVVGEVPASDMVATQVNGALVLLPTKPLNPSSSYLVLLTNGLTDVNSTPLRPSGAYSLAKDPTPSNNPSLASLQGLVGSHLAIA